MTDKSEIIDLLFLVCKTISKMQDSDKLESSLAILAILALALDEIGIDVINLITMALKDETADKDKQNILNLINLKNIIDGCKDV